MLQKEDDFPQKKQKRRFHTSFISDYLKKNSNALPESDSFRHVSGFLGEISL